LSSKRYDVYRGQTKANLDSLNRLQSGEAAGCDQCIQAMIRVRQARKESLSEYGDIAVGVAAVDIIATVLFLVRIVSRSRNSA